MNKKLLICAAIATGLLLTACVKKEAPKEEEQTDVASSEPVNLQPLEQPVEEAPQAIPETVQIERTETQNTTTEIRRSVQEAQPTETTESVTPAPIAAVTPKVEEKPAVQPKANRSTSNQSEDDAVAAAIAAATPALEN
ncbi:internalin [Acinetobacter sp. Ac_877]|uniref:internalin n=1 Tax=Acinetobacter portensis TaxID=1839785 RepID=UPI00128BE59A|nr:internalin [Acinetobacter portensis]MPW40461.1 internalin [Acinetobacter portensis]